MYNPIEKLLNEHNDKKTPLEDTTASDKPSPETETVTIPVEPDGNMTDIAVVAFPAGHA